VDRWNRLHPGEEQKMTWIAQSMEGNSGVNVIASDYVKALPNSIARWFEKTPVALGTDGFGRSDSRPALRRFFEVDAAHIVVAALNALATEGAIDATIVEQAIRHFDINPTDPNPSRV
jgi:pyruvate dehydrogenase E1 component